VERNAPKKVQSTTFDNIPVSTRDLLKQLRQELSARSLRVANFSDFSFAQPAEQKPVKFPGPQSQLPLRAVI
jgi:hypothetical protein